MNVLMFNVCFGSLCLFQSIFTIGCQGRLSSDLVSDACVRLGCEHKVDPHDEERWKVALGL